MFRGIDPEGLLELAIMVEARTTDVRHQLRSALDILSHNGRDVGIVASTISSIDRWGASASTNLRWRAEAIRNGQERRFDVVAILRAEFAASTAFSIKDIDPVFREWLANRQGSEQRITAVVANITAWLDQGWTDWDVSNDDLHNISSTLSTLSGRQLDSVVARLSPTQLKRWIQEMGNAGNGFSRDEKRQVFALLTTNTSGTSLGLVHDAILTGGGREEAIDFGVAIRTYSSQQTIVDFVAHAVGQDLHRHRFSGVAPALAAQGVADPRAIDKMARAIVTADEALALIAVDSLIAARIEDTGTACIDINPLASLITAMSDGADPRLKANTFAALVRFTFDTDGRLRELLQDRHGIYDSTPTNWLGSYRGDQTATDVRNGAQTQLLVDATRLLTSDASGVVEVLATNLDQDGALTTAFLRQLVDLGRGDELHRIVTGLRGGEVVDATRFAVYGSDSDYPYPHAQNLAFLAGGLGNALASYADDAKTRIDALSIGAGLATGVVGPIATGLHWAAATVIPMLGDGAVNWSVGNNVQGNIDEQLARLTETVETRLQPLRTLNGPPTELGEAGTWWDHRYLMIRHLG